jgi:hypothetical protein
MAQPDFIDNIDDTITDNIINQPVQVKQVQQVQQVIAEPVQVTAEPAEPAQVAQDKTSETVIIEHPHRYFSKIEPQEKKWWHFKFRSVLDERRLTQQLAQINLTAAYNYEGQKNADVILTQQETVVGKIHFLHFDRRDKGNKSKYYIKIFLYQFSNPSQLEAVKQVIYDFFSTMTIHHSLTKRSSKQSSKRSTKQSSKRNKTKKRSVKK